MRPPTIGIVLSLTRKNVRMLRTAVIINVVTGLKDNCETLNKGSVQKKIPSSKKYLTTKVNLFRDVIFTPIFDDFNAIAS